MSDDRASPRLPQHILPTAGTMLGLCTTLIGLVKLLEPQTGPSRVDQFGGLVAAVFLVSAFSSYASLRLEAKRSRLSLRLERTADVLFLIGLAALSVLALVFAYEVL